MQTVLFYSQVDTGVSGAQNIFNLLCACRLGENVELVGHCDDHSEVYYMHLLPHKHVSLFSFPYHLMTGANMNMTYVSHLLIVMLKTCWPMLTLLHFKKCTYCVQLSILLLFTLCRYFSLFTYIR